MKKLIILIYFLWFSFILFSQNGKIKYCFCEYTLPNGKKLSPKMQLINQLKHIEAIQYSSISKSGDIKSDIVDYFKEREAVNRLFLMDSMWLSCKVTKITKKHDNYLLRKNKLVKKTIYLIDISCEENQNMPSNMRIISLQNRPNKGRYHKIKIGETYKFYLVSHFEKDCCVEQDSDTIYFIVNSNKILSCFWLNNIWVVNLNLYENWYKTPSLDGLFYIPLRK